MDRVGVVYHPKIPAARTLAQKVSDLLASLNVSCWTCSAWDEREIKAQAPGTALGLTVGGDGTILRMARAVAFWQMPIVGVNLGHLGFMTEVSGDEIMDRLPALLKGDGWVDERTMLQVQMSEGEAKAGLDLAEPLYCLNDVVLGRGAVSRVVYIEAAVNGEPLTTYRADGVIVATATGSTGYSLAAGGPIIYPQADEILIKPVSAHLTMAYALVLPSTAVIELKVRTDHEAMLSVDGQISFVLQDGDRITVRRSPYVARFLRIFPPDFFYRALEQRLKLRDRSVS